MTAINFPNNPDPDELFTIGELTWKWSEDLGVWQGDSALPVIPEVPVATPVDRGIVYGISVDTTDGNTALGYDALSYEESYSLSNTAIGANALKNHSSTGPAGSDNVAIGNDALINNRVGSSNVVIGSKAMPSQTNSGAGQNVVIGQKAGYLNDGSANVFLGYNAGFEETGSNKLYIANSNTTTPLIHGDFYTSVLTVNGTLTAIPETPANKDSAKNLGYVGMPQVSTATGITLSAAHAGKHIYTTGNGVTHTIPANANAALEIGTTFVFINPSAISTTIAISSDTLILAGTGATGSRTLAQNGMATAVKITTTSWMISGNGLT